MPESTGLQRMAPGGVRPGAGVAPPETAEALLTRLEWSVLRRLDGLLQGDYRTLLRGSGLDLADLRAYQTHDDVRHIDWNVTARLQEPHVREFTEDRDLTAWLLLDLSGSVDFGGRRTKRAVATEFSAVLTRWLTRGGNRVGALLYGGAAVTLVPAGSGRRQVLRLLHELQRSVPQPPSPGGETRLQALLEAADRMIRRRAVVCVVSDFISAPGWDAALGRLGVRHDTLAVRLVDALERDLPNVGLVTLEDAETGERLQVDTQDQAFRARYARAAAAHEEALRDAFRRSGVDTIELMTDDDVVDAMLRHAELKRLRRRTAAGATSATSGLRSGGPR